MVFPALFDSGHAAWGVGALGLLAVPILAVRPVAAAAPALRERAVRAAVVVISGLVPHEAFKRLVIAIREIHRIELINADPEYCHNFQYSSAHSGRAGSSPASRTSLIP